MWHLGKGFSQLLCFVGLVGDKSAQQQEHANTTKLKGTGQEYANTTKLKGTGSSNKNVV